VISASAGVYTFLFTDIEGSTRLWEEHPGEMRSALARHDAVVREAIEGCGGEVFKTVGDAFCAVFAAPGAAVEAAVRLQLALANEPLAVPLRVRVAVHTGTAEARDQDFFGPALNRLARLLAVAHGEQVLLSEAVRTLVRDELPPAATLAPLGEHRLKDLQRPEAVYQLVHAGLRRDFPPLRSLGALPNNLPQQTTSFVGRVRELTEVVELLAGTRLLTLAGPGGTGKTRLALQVGAELLDRYPDGVWLVELAEVTDGTLAARAVAGALQMPERPGIDPTAALAEYLRTKRLLILLDNCEHLVEACAALVETLLRGCPDLRVLATSREPLGVTGEQTYRLSSLAVPVDRDPPPTAEALSQFEAVKLFIDRAVAVLPDFTVTNANAPTVAEICHRLDGIPLAIELAAARVRVLNVEQIAVRLRDSFRLLAGGSRSALPRQQTLRALIDWSHDLLSDGERALLRRLSVFCGGWTLDAAETVCVGSGIEEGDVLDLLTALVDKSLVTYDQAGAGRYRMLETIRQYARERLAEAGELDALRRKHREFVVALVEEARPRLFRADQVEWMERLEVDHDNIRAALESCEDSPGAGVDGLRIAGALWRFWWDRGHLNEARARYAAALAHPGAQKRTAARAWALLGAGVITQIIDAPLLGTPEPARPFYEESLTLFRELGDTRGAAMALGQWAQTFPGEWARQVALMREAASALREEGDHWGAGQMLRCLIGPLSMLGEDEEAERCQKEALEAWRQLGDRRYGHPLMALAGEELRKGNTDAAIPLLQEARVAAEELGDFWILPYILANTALARERLGDLDAARGLHEDVLRRVRDLGHPGWTADTLRRLWSLDHALGRTERLEAFRLESLALCEQTSDLSYAASILQEWGRIAEELGDREEASRLFARSRDAVRRSGRDPHTSWAPDARRPSPPEEAS
jgi:predicted ATPase/class 3 adenylate cyclase